MSAQNRHRGAQFWYYWSNDINDAMRGTMPTPDDPIALPAPSAPKPITPTDEAVIDLSDPLPPAPEPVFHDPVTAELEVEILTHLNDPAETTRLSHLLRNCLLTACEEDAVAWPEVICAYRHILEEAAATAAPAACRASIATDAAAVLGGAPDDSVRAQAAALLSLGRGFSPLAPGVPLESA